MSLACGCPQHFRVPFKIPRVNSPESNSPSSSHETDQQSQPISVLLALDVTGRILTVVDAAGNLWKTDPAGLVGLPVVDLISFDIVSSEDDWKEAQWDALLVTAGAFPVSLHAKTFDAGLVAITLRIHAACGGPTAYFAEIRTLPLPSAISALPLVITSTPMESGADLLAARSTLGFFDISIPSGLAHYSPGWKLLLGLADQDVDDTYDTWLRLIHPEDTSAAPHRVGKQTSAGSHNFSVEFRMLHKLGHYTWVQCIGTRITGPHGSLERVLGVTLDIAERKELEEQSFANEDRLQRLSVSDNLALFDLDFATQTHWFSKSCAPLLGAGDEETSVKTLLQTLPEPAAEDGIVSFLSTRAPGKPFFSQVLKLRTPDGEEKSVVFGAHRQWSRRRELVRVVGFISTLPAGREDGPMPAAMMSSMLGAIGEGVVVTDAHSRIIYLNPKAEQLTGWSLGEASKFKLNDVFKLVRQEDGKSDDTAVDLVLAVEETPRLYAEHALVSANGKVPAPILWTARQGWDLQGKPQGIVVVFRDPQEMTLSPEEIVRANRFESLGQLAGGIAHDFNNLLTTILGGISQAKDNHDYSKLTDAESACSAAKSLTRQLLTFSKGSSANAAQQVVIPTEILHDAVRIAAAGSTAVITVEVKEGTSPIKVDRGQILQVFQNLIINAVQAMPDPSAGRVTLRATNVVVTEGEVPPLPTGSYVQIEVEDNGAGIPPENLGKIFEPFFSTKKQGTGLGLATVLAIVRKHGGQIGVDSTVGTGTTFTLFIPQSSLPIEVPVRKAPVLRFGTGRLLFMDDDAKICDLTAGMLASLDYTFDIVKNGADAIAFYKRYLNIGRPYDAVILDLNIIGGMGGEECFKALRDLHPEVRAVVSSGYDSDEMARRYYDMGFVGYLSKPYRAAELGKAIKSALGAVP